MDWESLLDKRPIVVAVAGSNGAGKSTFYHAHLANVALRYVNADDIAAELVLGAYEGADVAAAIRGDLIAQGESFIFETVFSDPHGAKVAELEAAAKKGLPVVLIFIRIDSPETSKQRVSMRVMQGGHDVPDDKLETRFDRTLANLERAIHDLPVVLIFGNSDLANPYRLEAVHQNGERMF
ncbi:MAG: putative ABC-type ATPase [Limisphaerales bacterium]|jgi:predicted ABC-type ATPase